MSKCLYIFFAQHYLGDINDNVQKVFEREWRRKDRWVGKMICIECGEHASVLKERKTMFGGHLGYVALCKKCSEPKDFKTFGTGIIPDGKGGYGCEIYSTEEARDKRLKEVGLNESKR